MSIRNTIKILLNNFSTVWKILLYKVIILFISCALLAGFVLPNVITILNSIKETGLFTNLKNIIDAFFARTDLTQNIEAFKTSLENSSIALAENATKLVLSYIYIAIIIIISNMLSGMSDLVSGDLVNADMSANAKYSFLSRFVITLGSNIRYQLLRLVTEIPIYIIILYVVWKIFSFLFNYIAVFALFFAFVIFIILLSLSQAFFCCQLPEIIINKTLPADALRIGFNKIKPYYLTTFSGFVFINIFLIFINIILAFFTCGAGLLISVPMTTLFIAIYRLVTYYDISKMKYYTDSNTIITHINDEQ